jgi:hypothetical protein
MTQPTVARVLIWLATVATAGGMCSTQLARAESRVLLPIIAEPEDSLPQEEEPAIEPAEPAPEPARKPAARKRAPVATKSPARAAQKASRSNAAGGGRQPTAEYRRIRDAWHLPIPAEQIEPVLEGSLPPLVLAPIDAHGGERVTLTPSTDKGGFTSDQQALAARAFSPLGRKKPHPISPRLLDLVYRAMRHFDAPLVHLISGYRADRAGSRHTQGRAIDMVLPGVSNEELAAYVRQFGFVGVGVYPKSGFVHLDVRDSSFFWVDNSLPNERCRPEPTLLGEAKAMDARARDRGEEPNTFVPNNDKEDKAADRAYKRRAQQRRKLASQQARNL